VKVKVVENPKELDDAFTVRRVVFVDEQNVPVEEEIDQFENDSTHFVMYREDSPIGAGRFRILDEIGKVERICVLKDVRKLGAGQQIMNAIESYAKKNRIHKLKLNAQTHATPFYSRLGYEIVSEEFLDAGIPHRTMIKTI
jgi:predicted GNAT family N-acyltransferase